MYPRDIVTLLEKNHDGIRLAKAERDNISEETTARIMPTTVTTTDFPNNTV